MIVESIAQVISETIAFMVGQAGYDAAYDKLIRKRSASTFPSKRERAKQRIRWRRLLDWK